MSAARWKFAFVVALTLFAVPGFAGAQDGLARDGLLTRQYALVGGGVTDFADGAVKDRFGVGGSWDLRLGVGSRFYVGGEVAYVGAARTGEGAGADLLSNGAEAVLRVQYPYATGKWLVEPFAFGGVGWNRISLRDEAPGLEDSDDVGVVPFGGGVTLGYGRLLVDARFTYRESFDEDLPLALGEEPADLSQWGVSASVGYEF